MVQHYIMYNVPIYWGMLYWVEFTVPPACNQAPHRHNAVALDLCTYIHPDDGGKIYTFIGFDVDTDAKIVNGLKHIGRPVKPSNEQIDHFSIVLNVQPHLQCHVFHT